MSDLTVNGKLFNNLEQDDVTNPFGLGEGGHRVIAPGEVDDNFFLLLESIVIESTTALLTSSITSNSITNSASRTFTVAEDRAFQVGVDLKFVSDADPLTNFMYGNVTSYTVSTLELIVLMYSSGGGGTFADWSIFRSGSQGAPGPSAPSATTTVEGIAEIATLTETNNGALDNKIITPAKLNDSAFGLFPVSFTSDEVLAAVQGDGYLTWEVPAHMNGMLLESLLGILKTAGITGSMTIDIFNINAVVDMLSSPLTFSGSAISTTTTATVKAAPDGAVATGERLRIDITTIHTTPGLGLDLTLFFRKPG